jgi:hypothetical protein
MGLVLQVGFPQHLQIAQGDAQHVSWRRVIVMLGGIKIVSKDA